MASKKDTSNIHHPSFSQTLCTALQVALVDLLRSWNVYPSAVVGHSSGEIAAAYCVGSISPESAWKIAYYRGILSSEVAERSQPRGAMLSVGLSESKARSHLHHLGMENRKMNLTVGCINSPDNVTITGAEDQINALKASLDGQHIFARKLKVNVAYHSMYMQDIALEYERLLNDIAPENSSPSLLTAALFSTVSGEKLYPERLRESRYWAENLVSPVQFVRAITAMCSQTLGPNGRKFNGNDDSTMIDYLLEIGPHSALQGPIKETLRSIGKNGTIAYSSMLSRNNCALETSLTAAGRLYCSGYPVELAAINHQIENRKSLRMLVDLPEYPFNHSQTHWLESRFSKDFRFRRNAPHELLGTTARNWNPLEPQWRNFMRESENPWISDHKVCYRQ